ncbi:linear amide C-N hydrolase [Hydrogenimonas sp.]
MSTKKTILTLAVAALMGLGTASRACTALHLKAKDGGVVVGRTMEFGIEVHSNAVVVPAGTKLHSSLPAAQKGIRYTTKYGMVGLDFMGKSMLVDGMNEKGLYVGALYLPGYAKYPKLDPHTASKSMAPEDYVAWILGNFSSVEEVRRHYADVILVQHPQKEIGGQSFPGHFLVTDRHGDSVVIEPLEGGLKIYDNPLGVLTNSPTFDWHIINLSNYVNLSAVNVPKIDLESKRIKSFGQGSGLVGLPGDFTPPSRFIRAVAFAESAIQLPTARETMTQVFHIMNNFDIPYGSIREVSGETVHYDYTQWTSAADLKNLVYAVRTYEDQTIRAIDLAKALKGAKGKVRVIRLDSKQPIVDISNDF